MPLSYFGILLAVMSLCLVIHELGHWVMLTKYKVPTERYNLGLGPKVLKIKKVHLNLFPIGMAIVPPRDAWEHLQPARKFNVAIAGPMMSVFFAIILYGCASLDYYADQEKALRMLGHVNLAIAFFNLIPIPPLDGYMMLESHLASKGKIMTEKSKVIVSKIGNGFIYGLGFYSITNFLVKQLQAMA